MTTTATTHTHKQKKERDHDLRSERAISSSINIHVFITPRRLIGGHAQTMVQTCKRASQMYENVLPFTLPHSITLNNKRSGARAVTAPIIILHSHASFGRASVQTTCTIIRPSTEHLETRYL